MKIHISVFLAKSFMFLKQWQIAKEAKECTQECVTEYISFITSEAADICQEEKRKTITSDDILEAMKKLGFEAYCDHLREYLNVYRKVCAIYSSFTA